jgi:alpha-tubulin suppressor-like RCC1 family protein
VGWGNNSVGELGDGTRTSRSIPVRVTGVPAYIAGISAGRDFAAATGTNGEVWSRGSDDNGPVGNGSAANRSGQVQVTGLTIAIATQVAAGGASSFAARTVAYLLGS